MNSCAAAARAAVSMSVRLASGRAKAMFSATVRENRKHVLLDVGYLRAQAGQAPVAQVDAVDRDPAGVGIVGAVDQLRQGGLAGAGLTDDRHRLARFDAHVDLLERLLTVLVPERHPFEGDGAAQRGAAAAAVLVQFGGCGQHRENAARAGDAGLHHRERERGHEGGNAQQVHQPDQCDQFAEFDAAGAQQHDAVQERERHRHAEHQHRHVQRLDAALAHEQVAEQRRTGVEPLAFPGLPHRGLDQFDAGHGFLGGGGHVAVLNTLFHQHRAEAPRVVAHREYECHREQPRHHQQPGIEQAHVYQGRDESQHHVGHEHQAGVDHLVEVAGVVGGARHQVADPLAVVVGLALAEQAAVQFVAGVAFQPMAERHRAQAGAQGGDRVADQNRQQHPGGGQQGGSGRAVDHHLRDPADHHRAEAEQRPCSDRAHDRAGRQEWMVAQVGGDPAQRRAGVVAAALGGGPGCGEFRDHECCGRCGRDRRVALITGWQVYAFRTPKFTLFRRRKSLQAAARRRCGTFGGEPPLGAPRRRRRRGSARRPPRRLPLDGRPLPVSGRCGGREAGRRRRSPARRPRAEPPAWRGRAPGRRCRPSCPPRRRRPLPAASPGP